MSSLAEKYQAFVLPTYGRFDLDIARGSGCLVWDFDGREFLDFGAGIAVCSLGHAHPEITEAISRQAATLVHASNLYRTAPQAALAGRLVGITGPGKVFFCNSGAEANEGLIKLARRFGSMTGRHEILTFEGSFHGRTMAGISATGQQKVKTGFGPLLEGFRHLPFGDLEAVEAAVGPSTVAVLVEPVQGEGGIHIAREAFLTGLRELCDRRDLLLLFDEVQCGLGRTGEWCGWKSLAPHVQPDGVSWAKGIANGFPLGAFWIGDGQRDDRGPLCDLLGPGSHGTTYGGNPVACTAGLKVLEIIERDNLRAAAVELGNQLVSALLDARLPHVSEVRSLGLMVGIQFDRESFPQGSRPPALETVVRSMGEGLLAIPAGETVVRLLPPLNVTADEIGEAVKKFSAAIGKLAKGAEPAPIRHS
ncbi:MAG: acetylornithine/succinylornithine family transaminase [Terrimicrobiaceae bacterium]|nr:acetylornithine/succinylornithine family transaminase [Terrimicrobiaceae bacterium]